MTLAQLCSQATCRPEFLLDRVCLQQGSEEETSWQAQKSFVMLPGKGARWGATCFSGMTGNRVWPGSLAGGTHSHVCERSRHHPRKGKEAGDGYRGMLNGLRVAELQAKCVFGRSPPPCFSVGSSSVGSELLDVQCPPKGCASPAVNSRPKEPTWEGGT